MKGIDLFEAIGDIDEKYIQELDDVPKVAKFMPKQIYSAIACLVLLVISAWNLHLRFIEQNNDATAPMLDTPMAGMPMESALDMGMPMDIEFIEENVESTNMRGMDGDLLIDDLQIEYEEKVYYVLEAVREEEEKLNLDESFLLVDELENGYAIESSIVLMNNDNLSGQVYYDTLNDLMIIYSVGADDLVYYIICIPEFK